MLRPLSKEGLHDCLKGFVEITAALDEKESQTAAPQAPVQEARSFIMGTNERRDYSVSGPFTEASIEKKLDTLQNLLADQIKKMRMTG